MDNARSTVSVLLRAIRDGDAAATERLWQRVYDDLHSSAAQQIERHRGTPTLEATALVNETYLKLVGHEARLEDRRHFFGAASRAMRQVLIEHARRRNASKRSGAKAAVTLSEANDIASGGAQDVLAVIEAFERLQAQHPGPASVLDLKLFSGLSDDDIALVQERELKSVQRNVNFGMAFLRRELEGGTLAQ